MQDGGNTWMPIRRGIRVVRAALTFIGLITTFAEMGPPHSTRGRTTKGRARITDAKRLGFKGSYTWKMDVGTRAYSLPRKIFRSKVSLRVTPDGGGSEFKSQATVWGGDQELLVDGNDTYVLYDPAHAEKCEIDLDRIEQEFGCTPEGKRWMVIPRWMTAERDAELKALADRTLTSEEKLDPVANVGAVSGDHEQRTPANAEVVTGLKDLVDMHASGALSDAEFAEAKSRLLEGS
jgi:hypothetical protein